MSKTKLLTEFNHCLTSFFLLKHLANTFELLYKTVYVAFWFKGGGGGHLIRQSPLLIGVLSHLPSNEDIQRTFKDLEDY